MKTQKNQIKKYYVLCAKDDQSPAAETLGPTSYYQAKASSQKLCRQWSCVWIAIKALDDAGAECWRKVGHDGMIC